MVRLVFHTFIHIALACLIVDFIGISEILDVQEVHISIESDTEQKSGFESIEESEDYVNEYGNSLLVIQGNNLYLSSGQPDYKDLHLTSIFVPPEHLL